MFRDYLVGNFFIDRFKVLHSIRHGLWEIVVKLYGHITDTIINRIC